jgi:hypothetical protein
MTSQKKILKALEKSNIHLDLLKYEILPFIDIQRMHFNRAIRWLNHNCKGKYNRRKGKISQVIPVNEVLWGDFSGIYFYITSVITFQATKLKSKDDILMEYLLKRKDKFVNIIHKYVTECTKAIMEHEAHTNSFSH